MARKGVQKIQIKIDTNDELDELLQHDGLILLEVYSEWFGPCAAMAATLKKIKMKIGGDRLHMAVVQCDHIDVLQRFVNKSEPIWLFVQNRRIVNCVLGTNVPELLHAVQTEMDELEKDEILVHKRRTFALNELSSIEQQRHNVGKKLAKQKKLIKEMHLRQKHIRHMQFITNKITSHMSDMGVTILLPHTMQQPDLIPKLYEAGSKLKMTAKDRALVHILPEHLDIINYDSTDPNENIPMNLWKHIVNEDVLMVCWKISDDELRPVECMCEQLVQLLINRPDEAEVDVTMPDILMIPPIVFQTKIIDELVIDENETDDEYVVMKTEVMDVVEQIVDIYLTRMGNSGDSHISLHESQNELSIENEIENIISYLLVGAKSDQEVIKEETMRIIRNIHERDINEENLESSHYNISDPNPPTPTCIVSLNGIWTPSNKQTNALLIYLFFKSLTEHFLPPDHGAGRPHILMIFDVVRYRAVLPVIEEYRCDILAFGYFSGTENVQTVKLQAKTNVSYECLRANQPSGTKIALKVASDAEDAVLALGSLEPNYISQNEEEGQIDCDTYFPPGYPTGVQMADIQYGRQSIISNRSSIQSKMLQSTCL